MLNAKAIEWGERERREKRETNKTGHGDAHLRQSYLSRRREKGPDYSCLLQLVAGDEEEEDGKLR
jgi:hypothetical protein